MKSTGIIRKIDDLGRVVIPKEIRKNLLIKESDNLEIFINNNEIILKKYSQISKIYDIAKYLCDTLYNNTKNNVIIFNTDKIITSDYSIEKKYVGKRICASLLNSIKNREKKLEKNICELHIFNDISIKCSYVLSTILVNSEVLGAILMFNEERNLDNKEYLIINIVSSFIEKYLEE